MKTLFTALALTITSNLPAMSQCDFEYISDEVEIIYYGFEDPTNLTLLKRIDSVRSNENGHIQTFYRNDNGHGSTRAYSYVQSDSGYLYDGKANYDSLFINYKLCAEIGEKWKTSVGAREYVGEAQRLIFGEPTTVKVFEYSITNEAEPDSLQPVVLHYVAEGFGTVATRDIHLGFEYSVMIAAVVNGVHIGAPVTSVQSEIISEDIKADRTMNGVRLSFNNKLSAYSRTVNVYRVSGELIATQIVHPSSREVTINLVPNTAAGPIFYVVNVDSTTGHRIASIRGKAL